MNELWTPPDAKVLPTAGKADGGSYFDDELLSQEDHDTQFRVEVLRLIKELNQHSDKVVYVSSDDERHKMRAVFNSFKEGNLIGHWPTIKIDYGIPEGTIRIDWDHS